MRLVLEKKLVPVAPVVITENVQANMPWEVVEDVAYSKKAVLRLRVKAVKLSMKKNVYEVHLVALGEDDPLLQEFYKDGCLRDKMF